MTPEQAKALQPGDEVYEVLGSSYESNARIDRQSVLLIQVTVVKVTPKSVRTARGTTPFGSIVTMAEGDTAKAAYAEALERQRVERGRLVAAGARIKAVWPKGDGYSNGTSAMATTPDEAERLAAWLETGAAAERMSAEFARQLVPDCAPVVVLTLTIAQAERVLAALR